MRHLARMSAIGTGVCCALFLGSPAIAAESPGTSVQMCSEHTTPGIFGGLLPTPGNQTRGCMSSSVTTTDTAVTTAVPLAPAAR
ncbi:MAG TPA: hypothetical protein VE546_08815 [Streptomyces sp.]|uniref:hypothetical protein n=1 Tax=Streptomyces sp. TaxID=1931 RepID=UPI002D6791A1|nr:hypothetical protein [Streptomyces sp.]HZG03660.1 hypothetical protein [Streptomyces sp.]